MTLIYWKSDKFWLGKLLEHPEIMTLGETLEELEENIKDAQTLMKYDPFRGAVRSKCPASKLIKILKMRTICITY